MTPIPSRLAAAAFAALIAAAPASPAHAQREVREAADPYIHRVAGVRFPATIGSFRRGRVFEYDEQGADASVGYKVPAMPGEMTLYVYPREGGECRDEFASADAAVMNRSGPKRDAAAAPLRLLPDGSAEEISGTYAIPAGAMGFDHPDLVSHLWVGCLAGDRWVVKYRGSVPAGDAARSADLAQQLFAAIDWTTLTEE